RLIDVHDDLITIRAGIDSSGRRREKEAVCQKTKPVCTPGSEGLELALRVRNVCLRLDTSHCPAVEIVGGLCFRWNSGCGLDVVVGFLSADAAVGRRSRWNITVGLDAARIRTGRAAVRGFPIEHLDGRIDRPDHDFTDFPAASTLDAAASRRKQSDVETQSEPRLCFGTKHPRPLPAACSFSNVLAATLYGVAPHAPPYS